MSDPATSTSDWGVSTPRKILLAGGAIVVLGLVAAGIVYGAEKNSGGGSPDGLSTVHEGLLGTASDLEGHAATMREHGEAMSQAGQGAGNQRWIDQGVSQLSAARQMESIADQLRGTDRDLRLFPPDESVNIYRLRGDGDALLSAGRSLVEHPANWRSSQMP